MRILRYSVTKLLRNSVYDYTCARGKSAGIFKIPLFMGPPRYPPFTKTTPRGSFLCPLDRRGSRDRDQGNPIYGYKQSRTYFNAVDVLCYLKEKRAFDRYIAGLRSKLAEEGRIDASLADDEQIAKATKINPSDIWMFKTPLRVGPEQN